MIRRLGVDTLRDPGADPHRFWPSRNGGLLLAVMRWNATYCTVHVYEEPDPSPERRLLAMPTERETEVLHWLAQGKSNAAVAAILDISEATVTKHVQRALAKLHCENRTGAVALFNAMWARYARHWRRPLRPRHPRRINCRFDRSLRALAYRPNARTELCYWAFT